MRPFSQLTSTQFVSANPDTDQTRDENVFIDSQSTTHMSTIIYTPIDRPLDNSSLANNITDEFGGDTIANRTLLNELDLKFTLIFIINFQVILFNALIIAHVLKAKQFQKSSSARYFVLSLAISDILVGFLVMPLGIISLIKDTWLFGKEMCIFWQLIDFFCCTASIFNLCTVSIDRYIAISKPLLYMRMGPTRVLLVIGVVWLISALMTFPPIIIERLDKGESYLEKICKNSTDCSGCGSLLDLNPVYVVFASILSFFLPVLVVIITNYRTYLIVKRHMFARTNHGRIRLPANAANKEKSKNAKLFFNLFAGKKEVNNNQIELNSLENKDKSASVGKQPNHVLINRFQPHICYYDKDALYGNEAHLHPKTENRNLICVRLNRCFSWLVRRDSSELESRVVESKLIATHPNPHYSSCGRHFHHLEHHLHHHLDQNLNTAHTTPDSEKNWISKLTKFLIRCCTLDGLCNPADRQSKLSNAKTFFFLNNHSSNVQILDNVTHNLNSANNLKNIQTCALNTLNGIQFHKTNHPTKNELLLNDELLVDEESTSGSGKTRLDKDRDASISIFVDVNSHNSESNTLNDEIVNENLNGSNEASTIDSMNNNNLSPNRPNGCLINRCFKETNQASSLFQNSQFDCCGYCCTLCTTDCEACRTDFNKLFEILKSKNNLIKYTDKTSKSSKDSSCKSSLNNHNRNSSSNKPSTTKTSCGSSKSDKSCKPQHHLNCSHFKNPQIQANKTSGQSVIRCDHCGNTMLHDQCNKNKNSYRCKTLCVYQFTNAKSNKPADLAQNHFQQHPPKWSPLKSNHPGLNQQTGRHHCIHIHFRNLNQFSPVYSDPLSIDSNRRDESVHSGMNSGVNSGEKYDDNQPSSSSECRRNKSENNSSFDDELRINCGTGQLQKSIGLNWAQSRKSPGNSSTNNSDGGGSKGSRSAAKLKKLAHFAGNSVRNVGFRNSSSNNRLNTIRREYKATKTLAIITFVFVCMWLPYFTIFLLQATCTDCSIVNDYFSPFLAFALFLGWSNSYVNPLLCMYFSRKLRNSIINTLCCRKIN